MGQGGQAFGDGPEVTQAHGIHRQAAQRGHDPHAGALAVAVRVFPELRVTRPVPGIWLTDTSARPLATERVSADWVGR